MTGSAKQSIATHSDRHPRACGDPVRRGLSIPSLASLEYWDRPVKPDDDDLSAVRHCRARPGNSSSSQGLLRGSMDARIKSGHDECAGFEDIGSHSRSTVLEA